MSSGVATDPPIKILEIVDSLDAGGMEHQLVSLINRLDPNRFLFEICCLRHPGVNAAKLNPNVVVHSLRKEPGFRFSVVMKLRRLLRNNFDLVHTHNLGPLIYAALATGGGRTPIFHGEHSQFTPDELTTRRLWQRKFLYRIAAAVHTVSAGQRDELLKAGLKHRRLCAIVNGVNTQHFRPSEAAHEQQYTRQLAGLAHSEFVIGIVARFGSFKRHAELIRAFESLCVEHPHLRLLMVGDGGPEKAAVLEQLRASEFSNRISWAGYQSDPAPYYRAMDLLVVPSSNEGLSNTTLEAMATGVPVLSNDICGARELIAEGDGGWVRDLTSVESLAGQLRSILAMDEAKLSEVGARGRQRVSKLFSWDAMADNYAQWFAACVEGSSALQSSS